MVSFLRFGFLVNQGLIEQNSPLKHLKYRIGVRKLSCQKSHIKKQAQTDLL